MPLQQLLLRSPELPVGYGDLLAVQPVVAVAVLIVIAERSADPEDVFRSHGHVAAVVQAMKIAAKQQSVVYAMFAA
jgi:hypothetical protein